jgi:hypothetical protein
MSDEKNIAWISYMDERNIQRQGYFELVHLDSSFVKFKTLNGVVITIPTIRILKIKEKGVKGDGKN